MTKGLLSAVFIAGLACFANAQAAPILCHNPAVNHMFLDDSQAAACLASGIGNINGNQANDPFLTGVGDSYELVGKSDGNNPFSIAYTQGSGNSKGQGTWSFDENFWDTYEFGAIGFKFGTGNQPDMWFVYELLPTVSAGTWEFVNMFGRGGGLSHVNLYGIVGDTPFTTTSVPEPATMSLMLASLGLLGIAARRSRRIPHSA